MNHLDEGTIHAWLDGALDATRSHEIEAHVGQCAACSAAVAEARGLIAASSRILTALDDVPGGVVPKRAAPALKPARRQWRAAPWVSGIAAAALIAAIGIGQLSRNAPMASLQDEAVIVPRAAVQADTAAERVADTVSLSPPVSSARLASGPAAPASRPTTTVIRRDRAANQAPSDARASDAVAVSAQRAGGGAGEGARVAAVPAPEATAELKMEKAAVKAPTAPEPVSEAALVDVRQKQSGEETAVARLAGCYRIEPGAKPQRLEAVVSGVAGAVGRVAQGRAAAPAAAADRSTQRYATPAPPALVRLDTARHPLGYAAREAGSDSIVGAWWNMGRDSARVDMLAIGLFTFALKNRITCPER